MPDPKPSPSMIGPIGATVAASIMLVAALLAAINPAILSCALITFLAAALMALCAVWQWVFYFRAYIDYRIDQIAPDAHEL